MPINVTPNDIFSSCLKHEILREKYNLSERQMENIKLHDQTFPASAREILETLKATLADSTNRGFRDKIDDIFNL